MSSYQPKSPGEGWEVDSNGKRFYFDGRCIVYETTVTTTHGILTQEQIDSGGTRRKEKPAFVAAEVPPAKYCPFKTGVRTNCDGEACAWYTETGCAQTCPHPTVGRKCPYKRTACTYDCALMGDTE